MVIPATSRFGFRAEFNTKEFQASCISLANEIDAAIGRNEVPGNIQELALILNNVCRRKCDDYQTRAVVMALMISVKSACQLGWFPERETQELLAIIDLMWNGFSCPENVTSCVNSPVTLISQVIERFYPCVKLGHILVSFEAKPESKMMMKDFHISKKMPHSPKQKVGLFVVRTEDISRSNCIVHPQGVSFLLNGKGIDKRVNISMESGPQLPTNVTALLNLGANLLQAIGCFGDQKLRKILEEVGRNAADVVISADGTWMVETENDEDVELVPETTHDHGDPNSFINLGPTVKNPARDENEMETSTQVEEHNPCLSEIQGPSNDTHRPASDYTMLNQSHTSTNTLPQLPRTLNAFDGQQFVNLPQVINTRDSPASQALPMTFSPTPSPQDILATNAANFGTSMPAAQSSQFQGSHVTSLGNCEGRTSDLMARWNHIYGRVQTQFPPAPLSHHHYSMQNQSPSPAQQRPVPSYIAHPQTFHVNYGENADQRWMPSSIAHPQTLPVNYGGNTNQRPIPSSIAHPQTLPVNYRGNTDHRSTPYSITHLQTLLNYGGNADQRPMPSSITNLQTLPATYGGYAHQRPMSSSITHPRTSPVNYGGTPDQRPMPSSITHPQTLPVSYGGTTDQILNPGGAMGQFSSREFMNLTPANTENWRPQSRMRGSVAPGTGYDHMIIHPTRPVHPQAQTPPAPLSTSYDGADEIQAFIGHPSYPVSNNETQAGTSSLPVAEGLGYSGSFWSMPPETW